MSTRTFLVVMEVPDEISSEQAMQSLEDITNTYSNGDFMVHEGRQIHKPMHCPMCDAHEEGDAHLLLIDVAPPENNDNYFEDEIYGDAKCKSCGHVFTVKGQIDWSIQK